MTVTAKVWGAHEARELILMIDTGAAATSIEPVILMRPIAFVVEARRDGAIVPW